MTTSIAVSSYELCSHRQSTLRIYTIGNCVVGCVSNPGFLCWPRLYESSRWCTDKPVFRFKSWPLSVTRIIIEIMCSARIEMQQGSSAFSMTKTQSLKERTCFFQFWKVFIGWRKRGPDLFLTLTSDHCPPFNHFLLSKFLKCWMILLKYLLYLLIFWIFTIASRKLTQNDEIKIQNSE